MDEYIYIEQDEKDHILKKIFDYISTNTNIEKGKTYFINSISFTVSLDRIDTVIFENEYYYFHPKSRDVLFINEIRKKKKTIFVYNEDVIDNYMNKEMFQTFSLNDSMNSETDTSEFLNGDSDIIIFGKESKILTKETFRQFACTTRKIETIQNLSINSHYYYPKNYKDFFYLFKEYLNYSTQISKIIRKHNNHSIIQLFGPKNCSKSIFLLYLSYYFNRNKRGTFYINYEYLDKNKNKIREILYNELLYSAINEENVKKIYDLRLLDKLETENLMTNLLFLIKFYLEKMDMNNFNFNKIIFLDNIKNLKSDDVITLEKIINEIKSSTNKCSLIICGDGEFFNKNIRTKYEKKSDQIEILKLELDNIIINQKETINNNEFQYFKNTMFFVKGNNSKYNINDKDELINKELEYCKQFEFYYLFFCLEYNNNIFTPKEFSEFTIFDYMPNYYSIFEDENKVIIKLNNEVFEEAIKQQISFKVERGLYDKILFDKNFPRTTFGVAEEFLIILLFKYNKFNLLNLHITKENIIEVEKIALIKDMFPAPKTINKFSSILVHQKDFKGEFYDLIIIHVNRKYSTAIFIQIGTDKSLDQVKEIEKDFNTYKKDYMNKLNSIFGINVQKISLLFIFDFDTQTKREATGIKACEYRNIQYYLFSLRDHRLYHRPILQTIPLNYLEIDNKILDYDHTEDKENISSFCFQYPLIKPNYELDINNIRELETKLSHIMNKKIILNSNYGCEFRNAITYSDFLNKIKYFSDNELYLHVLYDKSDKTVIFYFKTMLSPVEIKDNKKQFSWDIYPITKL